MKLYIYYFMPEFFVSYLFEQKLHHVVNIQALQVLDRNLCVFFQKNNIVNNIIHKPNKYNETYFTYSLYGKKYEFIAYIKAESVIIVNESNDDAVRFELNKYDYSDWQNVLQRHLYERFANKKST